jgi:hypothetical protein
MLCARLEAALLERGSAFDAFARQWLLAFSKKFYQLQRDVDDDISINFQPFDLKLGQ